MLIKYLLGVLFLVWNNVVYSSSKPKLTLDEFFNYTDYSSLILSPDDGQSILIRTKHRIWDQNINEYRLHLYSLNDKKRKLVTQSASGSLIPQWKAEWIAYVAENPLDEANEEKYIHLYSTRTERTFPLRLGKEPIHAFTWSNTNTTLYFAAQTSWTNESEMVYKNEWKDVIQYREQERGDTIFRMNIENISRPKIDILTNFSFRIAEMICSSDGKHLIFSTESRSRKIEFLEDYEIYSFDVTNHSSSTAIRLTHNQAIERNLKLYNDESIFFTVTGEGSVEGDYRDMQGRLYSLNITTGHIHRWADQFEGDINDFAFLEHGREGVILLGQLRTEMQIYTQQTLRSQLIKRPAWNGTYEKIVTMFNGNRSTIAFIHSSFDVPQEVYFINRIEELNTAQWITNENKLFTQRNLPQGTSYRWLNKDDGTEIEGILRYPPDKFQQKNLPLLVLIHGGP